MSVWPPSSRASRTAATWPSIMPERPRSWEPARDCSSAIAVYRSRVASLSTRPRSSSTPQWPWSVNSSRHRSVCTTSRPADASTATLVATFRMPSGSVAPEPRASRTSGTPNSITPPTPAAAASATACGRLSRECCTTPGIDAIGTGAVTPSRTNSGSTSSAGCRRVSDTSRRMAAVSRRRRGRTRGRGVELTRPAYVATAGRSPGRGTRRPDEPSRAQPLSPVCASPSTNCFCAKTNTTSTGSAVSVAAASCVFHISPPYASV